MLWEQQVEDTSYIVVVKDDENEEGGLFVPTAVASDGILLDGVVVDGVDALLDEAAGGATYNGDDDAGAMAFNDDTFNDDAFNDNEEDDISTTTAEFLSELKEVVVLQSLLQKRIHEKSTKKAAGISTPTLKWATLFPDIQKNSLL
jgi:hypothetical protein